MREQSPLREFTLKSSADISPSAGGRAGVVSLHTDRQSRTSFRSYSTDMLLTLSTTHRPATDLGFLLHKHPDRCQTFTLSFGKVHVFYPESGENRCSACLLLDVDPVGIVRRRASFSASLPDQYVNDRPYAASSFMSVAISRVLGTALQGQSRERPELAQTPLPLTARIDVLPVRGGEGFLEQIFEPLGYAIEAIRHPLDDRFPGWGESPYFSVTLQKTTTVSELLTHLYVLIPVFDHHKHYFIGRDEMDKLLAKGDGWLGDHPQRDVIVRRYLRFRPSLQQQALAQLVRDDEADPFGVESSEARAAGNEQQTLNEQRLAAVVTALRDAGARRVLDLGCGEGKLLRQLLADERFEQIVGLDVCIRSLEVAHKRLHLDRLPAAIQARIQLRHGSLMYRDRRLEGFDAAAVVEVVEHMDPPRLSAFERVLFEQARPRIVVLTTPNREYNAMWDSLPDGRFRHSDHRFEWTRDEFRSWCDGICGRFHYTVKYVPIGLEHPAVGPPTQMAVFSVI